MLEMQLCSDNFTTTYKTTANFALYGMYITV